MFTNKRFVLLYGSNLFYYNIFGDDFKPARSATAIGVGLVEHHVREVDRCPRAQRFQRDTSYLQDYVKN